MSKKKLRSAYPAASTQELEYLGIHETRLEFVLQKISELKLPKHSRILDIGCYPPFVFCYLRQRGFELSGVAAHHEQLTDADISVCNIETDTLGWKANTFDAALITEVIEHLPHSPVFPLQEIFRVLKPGGNLLITTPNAVKLHHRLTLLAGKTTTFPIEQLLETRPGDNSIYHLHNREYSLPELYKVVCAAGFEVADATQVCLYPPFREKTQHEPVLSKVVKWAGFATQQLHPSFKDSLYLRAIKPAK